MQQKLWKGLLALLMFFCLSQPPAEAQEIKKDSITRYKWEVGTDLLWLIDKNSAPRNSVFIRRNFTTKNGKLRAWRLRVSGKLYLDKSDDGATAFDSLEIQDYAMFIRTGYEWQKQYGKFQLNYGIDAHFSWEKTKAEGARQVEINGMPVTVLTSYYSQTWQSGLVPFVGAKYFITPRWGLSAEANITAYYQHYNWLSRSGGGFGRKDLKSFNLSFNPFYVLQLSYFFN